jgi:PAS domain S-box-containing protein
MPQAENPPDPGVSGCTPVWIHAAGSENEITWGPIPAAAAGMRTGLILHLAGQGRPLARWECYSREAFPEDPVLEATMVSIGRQWMQFLERKRAEAVLRLREEQLAQDLSERKRMEDELRESERQQRQSAERLTLIFNNINEIAILIGVEGPDTFRALEFNEYYLARTTLSRDKLIGKLSSEIMRPEDYGAFADKLRQAIASGTTVVHEIKTVTMKGAPHQEMRFTPIRGSSGKVEHILIVGKDISELRKKEEELRQSQKMEAVGRLAGGIAHDFNNLLTAINGLAELAAVSIGDPKKVLSMLDEIRYAGERAAGLTQQLLAFSRKQILFPKVLDLNAVVDGMEALLRRLIRADIELAAIPGSGLKPIRMDAGQLEQIILNLALNGCDAMATGGKLTIETFQVDSDEAPTGAGERPGAYLQSYVVLAVTDSGIGIEPEILPKIFEPFFTTKEPGQGTGMGLATVYGILKQSGGHIRVYSEIGKGSTFKVYFPASDADAAARPKPAALSIPAAHIRGQVVFLVEDEPVVRTYAKQVLEDLGYRIESAGSGKEALEKLGKLDGPMHLLLTDLIMPGMSGPELWERVKSTQPEARVLFMSGYAENAVLHQGRLHIDAPFLQKPFNPNQLAEKVRESLLAPKAD